MKLEDDIGLFIEIVELIKKNEYIEAVKIVKKTGAGNRESKEYVDSFFERSDNRDEGMHTYVIYRTLHKHILDKYEQLKITESMYFV